MRLLSAFQFFFHRRLRNSRDPGLMGTIPPQMSTLTDLRVLYAPTSNKFIDICAIECWSCAPLSQPFKVNLMLFRALDSNRLEGTIPAAISALVKLTEMCALTSFLFSVGFVRLSLTSSFFFFHRHLSFNALTGTIPSEISTLTRLTGLYAQV